MGEGTYALVIKSHQLFFLVVVVVLFLFCVFCLLFLFVVVVMVVVVVVFCFVFFLFLGGIHMGGGGCTYVGTYALVIVRARLAWR